MHGDRSAVHMAPRATATRAATAGRPTTSRATRTSTYYPEYHNVVEEMDRIGQEQGCGRALWENNGRNEDGNGRYGTTMALMLLPFWTDGCIGSMEGLFFEASGTTPYMFLAAGRDVAPVVEPRARAALRQQRRRDVAVDYLQALGVRYLMVSTYEAVTQADLQPELIKLAESGPWRIYQVADSDIVVPLEVATRRRQRPRRRSARAVPGAGHVVVPEPGRLGGDAGRRRSGRVAADRRRGRHRPGGSRSAASAGHHRRPEHARRRRSGRHAWPAGERRSAGAGDRAGRARPDRGDERRHRAAVGGVRRVRGRGARPGARQLLPELGGVRCRGPVPDRPEPDGGGPDRGARQARRTADRRPTSRSTPSRSSASASRCSSGSAAT